MKKKISYKFLAILVSVLLIFGSTFTVYGDTKEETIEADLIKTYVFNVEQADNFHFDAPKEIAENGKKYKLTDVQFEVMEDNRIEVVREVVTSDTENFEKTIEHTLPNGTIITLTAEENINWQESAGEGMTKTKEYASRSGIPETITQSRPDDEGNPVEITLALADVENLSKTEDFSAPATFYSYSSGGTKYKFNEKTVYISGGAPTWDGYQEDVKAHLGINGSEYKITGGSWAGAETYADGKYVRQATFTGVRTTPVYRATFEEQPSYTANVTYAAYNGKGTIRAIATYDRAFGAKDIIKIGVGLLILAAALASIFFVVGKRRKKREEEEQARFEQFIIAHRNGSPVAETPAENTKRKRGRNRRDRQ